MRYYHFGPSRSSQLKPQLRYCHVSLVHALDLEVRNLLQGQSWSNLDTYNGSKSVVSLRKLKLSPLRELIYFSDLIYIFMKFPEK